MYLLEKEKHSQDLRLADRASVEAVLRSHVEHLQEELTARCGGGRPHSSSSGREEQLRRRVEELLSSLDGLALGSERRQREAEELIGDLKRANGTLAEALERSRRKIKRLADKKLESGAQDNSGVRSRTSGIPVPAAAGMMKSK